MIMANRYLYDDYDPDVDVIYDEPEQTSPKVKKKKGHKVGAFLDTEWHESEGEMFTRNVMWCFRWNVLDDKNVERYVHEFSDWLRLHYADVASKLGKQTTCPSGLWMKISQGMFPVLLREVVADYLGHTVNELLDPRFVEKQRAIQEQERACLMNA